MGATRARARPRGARDRDGAARGVAGRDPHHRLDSPAEGLDPHAQGARRRIGRVGGALGLGAVVVELPVSTTIMLRSIAQIAREEGEDLTRPEAALACVEVLALGGRTAGDATADSGYFAVRTVLARTVGESARFLLQRGLVDETAPILVRLVAQVAARFGLVVSQKLAAQAIPVLGAFGGAAVNLAFAEHFQTVARGHFTVRRLERAHGAEAIRFDYERLRNEAANRA